jgi:DnaB-like helicase C terminal domain
MKLLARELEVPVIAISQLNRGPEQRTDKRPMLSDLRESGSLEQDADAVFLVHRPDVWEADDPRAGEADLIIAKHGNGPTTTVAVAHQAALLPVRRPRRVKSPTLGSPTGRGPDPGGNGNPADVLRSGDPDRGRGREVAGFAVVATARVGCRRRR